MEFVPAKIHSIFKPLNATSVHVTPLQQPPLDGYNLATVICLLGLGSLGTFSNLLLLLAAFRPVASCAFPDSLSCCFANLAIIGIFESTLNMILSAFYTSGGYTTIFMGSDLDISTLYKAILIALLVTGATAIAWFVALSVTASLQIASLTDVRLCAVAIWPTCIGLGIATGWILSRNFFAISSTPVVPREKALNIPPALRYTKMTVGYALPWLLTLISSMVLAGRVSSNSILDGGNRAALLSKTDVVCVSNLVILHLFLRFPFDLALLMSGSRSTMLHAGLTWCRFTHAVVSPLSALVPGGRLSSILAEILKCCKCHTRSAVVSPPPTSHPAKAILGQISLVQPRTSKLVPSFTPIIFPTQHGLFLRLAQTTPNTSPTSSYSYRPADHSFPERSVSEPTKGTFFGFGEKLKKFNVFS